MQNDPILGHSWAQTMCNFIPSPHICSSVCSQYYTQSALLLLCYQTQDIEQKWGEA